MNTLSTPALKREIAELEADIAYSEKRRHDLKQIARRSEDEQIELEKFEGEYADIAARLGYLRDELKGRK